MPNNIKARRKQLKLTQQAVADAAGTTKATVMKLEKGDMQLTENWMKRLSIPLNCRPEALMTEDWPLEIPLVGEIYGKSIIKFFRELPLPGAGEPEPNYWLGLESVPRPPDAGFREVRALKVTDDALEPLLSPNSLVYFAEPKTEGFDDYMSGLVVCEVEDGNIHVARLQRGYNFGSYNLLKPSGAQIQDQTINWCAKVIFLKPV